MLCYSMIEVIPEDPPEYPVQGAQSVPVVRSKKAISEIKSAMNDFNKYSINVNKALNDSLYFNSIIEKFLFSDVFNLCCDHKNDLNLFSEIIIDYISKRNPNLNIVIQYEKRFFNNKIYIKVISKLFFKLDGIEPYYQFEKPSKIVHSHPELNLSNDWSTTLTSLFVRRRLEKEIESNANNFKYISSDLSGNKLYVGVMKNSAYLFYQDIVYFLIDGLFFNSHEFKDIIHYDLKNPETILFNSDVLDVIKMIRF